MKLPVNNNQPKGRLIVVPILVTVVVLTIDCI